MERVGIRTHREFREKRSKIMEDLHGVYQWHLRRVNKGNNWPKWRGTTLYKYPMDMAMYAEAIWTNQPDWIIETGTLQGGSAMFFADMLSLSGAKGYVITVDIKKRNTPQHKMVEYIVGSSTDAKIVEYISEKVQNQKVMVVLDSDHSEEHVSNEIKTYAPIVTSGQFMIVEDCHNPFHDRFGPLVALEKFMENNAEFELDTYYDRKFLVSITRGGWLKKKS